MKRGRLTLLACESGRALADRIFTSLTEERHESDARLVASQEIHFSNGEVKTLIDETVRGDDVYVVQSIADPLRSYSVNDNLMALVTAVNAAHQSDADHITTVLPQFPYSRQERKQQREGITAKQVARLLEISGANRVITMDIHAPAIGAFFDKARMDDLHASGPILDYFRANHPVDNLVVVGPDVGSANRARHFSKQLKTDMAIVDKERDYSRPSTIARVRLVGDVEGRDVFMVDDLIDTAGTIIAATQLLKDNGARDIFLACSLPFLTGPAVERLDHAFHKGLFSKLIGTDAVYRGQEFADDHPWYVEVSIAPLFARTILHINSKRSVSALLD